ncbi:BQ2448_5363 [Microbotryum intermedium]|uniref:BQ2448_5363 protein n=1 Tax=Microbotryum intermedium TaxID=269621 RepID=A0A238F0S5_9BASI|nr:BQ2448_5363 [Microbotryum intermedium]
MASVSPSDGHGQHSSSTSPLEASTSSSNTGAIRTSAGSASGGSSGMPRTGQRAITSCTYCYRRKVGLPEALIELKDSRPRAIRGSESRLVSFTAAAGWSRWRRQDRDVVVVPVVTAGALGSLALRSLGLSVHVTADPNRAWDSSQIRCNKEFPCSNCIARGISDQCHREPVVVRGHVVGGPQERLPLTVEQLNQENVALRKKVAAQERQINALLRAQKATAKGGQGTPQAGGLASRPRSREGSYSGFHDSPINNLSATSGAPPLSLTAIQSPGVLESCELDVLGLRDPKNQDAPFSSDGKSSLRSDIPSHHAIPLLDLVPIETSTFLVETHFRLLEWVHCVVHVPTFLQEHALWLDCLRRGERERVPRYDVLARYFAIIASTLYFLDVEHGAQIGYTAEDMVSLPRIWFNASLEALQRSDFLCHPSLESLQAICILPLIGHAYGESVYFGSLMHCALGLAQNLKFHLLTTEEPRPGLINREMSRRMWKCLIIAECLVPAKNCQPFSLFYPQARTVDPLNANDEDLSNDVACVPRPLHDPTIVSHLLGVSRIADLFREFSQVIFALPTIEAQWEYAMSIDNRLLHLLDFCPALKPRSTPYPTHVDINAPFDYLPWARHLWGTFIPLHRIMCLRLFLGKSYHDSQFLPARQICLNSAREFFAERRRPAPKMYRKSWHVSSLTVIAGMVLGTELIHGRPDPASALGLRAEVIEAMQQLADPGNAMTQRGIELLQTMITEHDRQTGDFTEPAARAHTVPPSASPVSHLINNNRYPTSSPMPSPPRDVGPHESHGNGQINTKPMNPAMGAPHGMTQWAIPQPAVPPTFPATQLPALEALWPSSINDQQDWSWLIDSTEWPTTLLSDVNAQVGEPNASWFGAGQPLPPVL